MPHALTDLTMPLEATLFTEDDTVVPERGIGCALPFDLTMSAKCVRVTADLDHGVPARILDLLNASDLFPDAMHVHRDLRAQTLVIVMSHDEAPPLWLLSRMGRISGVRHVSADQSPHP